MDLCLERDITYYKKECCCDRASELSEITNTLWDGMGIIDNSIFPENMEGFIYCRSYFFKSCLFRGNIQDYFRDYYGENYETAYETDMTGRRMKVTDIKVIVTENSLKWIKFLELMSKSGTMEDGFKYYSKIMKKDGEMFAIVETAHSSKYDELQRSSFQMNNTLLTTDCDILGEIAIPSIEYCNELKIDDEAFLKYLEVTGSARYSINEVNSGTVKRMMADWARFYEPEKEFIAMSVKDMTKINVDDFFNAVLGKHDLKKKAFYNMCGILKQTLEYAVDAEYIEKNPYRIKVNKKKFISSSKKPSAKEVFQADEKEMLIDEMERRLKNNPSNTAPLAVMLDFELGTRKGEILATCKADIVGNRIHIHRQLVEEFDTSDLNHIKSKGFHVVDYTKSEDGDRWLPLTALDPQNYAKSDQSDQNIIPFRKLKRAENIEKSTLSALQTNCGRWDLKCYPVVKPA